MKGRKLSMRELRKILEYRFDKHLSAEITAQALNRSKGSIINTVKRFKESGLSWPLSSDLTDTILEAMLYPRIVKAKKARKVLPDVQQAYSPSHDTSTGLGRISSKSP